MSNQNLKKVNAYILGLDIGIASVGWAVISQDHIIATGVRAFNKAETAKEGNSLNLARRQARLMRRRIQRKAVRLKRLVRILKKYELISDTQLFKNNFVVHDNVSVLQQALKNFGTYSAWEIENLKPLFVSRAPQRRNSGAAHKDTIYGQPERYQKEGLVTQKVALGNLTLKMLDDLVEPHRNQKLYEAIRQRLEQAGGKADKAFAKDKPLYKPSKLEGDQGPIVRSVKIIKKETGIAIRGGLAKNDPMIRVDVFTKLGKFYLVPVYVHHQAVGLPNKAILAAKDEVDWIEMDPSYAFKFSLYPNDYVVLHQKNKPIAAGYFGSTHRGTGGINIWLHDRATVGNVIGGEVAGLGVKTAVSFEKYEVDVLGNIYPARPEVRYGLA